MSRLTLRNKSVTELLNTYKDDSLLCGKKILKKVAYTATSFYFTSSSFQVSFCSQRIPVIAFFTLLLYNLISLTSLPLKNKKVPVPWDALQLRMPPSVTFS